MIVQNREFLEKQSENVSMNEGLEISKKLIDCLENDSTAGVGLSAPQIGLLKKVCVIQTSRGWQAFINPYTVNVKHPFIFKNEGCLSFPGIRLNTVRNQDVTIKDDLHGLTELNNFSSIVMQHEFDHLCGTVFFKRQVPAIYDLCFCGRKEKFKFCCMKKLYEQSEAGLLQEFDT